MQRETLGLFPFGNRVTEFRFLQLHYFKRNYVLMFESLSA